MAFIVQNQQGAVEGANAYADVDFMKSYHTDRGVSLSAYTDEQLSQALVRATDFLDSRYSFAGISVSTTQGTQMPKTHTGSAQWVVLMRACVQLAYRALLSPDLMPDPKFDVLGRIKSKTVKAGPVETSVEYMEPVSGRFDASVPSFPAVDLLLRNAGLLASRYGGSLGRA